MEESTESFHFPQLNRRTRLRFTPETSYQFQQQQQQQQQQEPHPFILSQQRPVLSHAFDHHHHHHHHHEHHENNLSLSLSFHHQEQDHVFLPVKQASVEGSRSSVPLGPFTGYATILKSSRFLSPAQGLLDDFCGVDGRHGTLGADLDCFRDCGIKEFISCSERFDLRLKNSKLLWLLEEVYKRYKVYCQQMQSVVASFRAVSGLGHAAPYIGLAFKAVVRNFSSLKNAILDHIICCTSNDEPRESAMADRSGPWRFGYCADTRNPSGNMAFLQHQGWRSQRGLPDHAVAMLKSWLFQHFLHPYPSDSEKQMLAHQTGLSRTQVSNWFINARVRLWKPMVEEMHTLEKSRAQGESATMELDHGKEICSQTRGRKNEEDDDSRGCINDYRFLRSGADHDHHETAAAAAAATGNYLGLSLYQRNGFQTMSFHPSGFDAITSRQAVGKSDKFRD